MAKNKNRVANNDAKKARKVAQNIKSRARKDLSLAKQIAKWEAKQAQLIAKEQIKEMRPYLKKLKGVDLRKNLTPAQKGFVTKAWRDYQDLTVRPHKVFKPKKKIDLKRAQKYANHEKGDTRFDVAFIPTPDPKAKIKVEKDFIIIKSHGVTEKTVEIDIKRLIENPDKEIARALGKHKDANKFVIMAGKHEFNGTLEYDATANQIKKFMTDYAKQSNLQKGDFFGNWMHGLKVYVYSDINKAMEYRDKRGKKLAENKRDRANKRRRNLYKYGKKF